MAVVLCTFEASAANTFILAYSDDGSAALLARRDDGSYGLELVSAKRDHAQQFTVAKRDCAARVKRLAASLAALKFTGVEARAKACAGAADTIVRTLKRHAEQAQESFAKEAPGVPEPPADAVYAQTSKLVLAFSGEKGGASLEAAWSREGETYSSIAR